MGTRLVMVNTFFMKRLNIILRVLMVAVTDFFTNEYRRTYKFENEWVPAF